MARRKGPRQRPARKARGRGASLMGIPSWLLGIAVAVVVVAVGARFLLAGGAPEVALGVELPAYVRYSARDVQEAYTYAVDHPEVLQYIPCYCGCGGHAGHQSNWNCFVKSMDGLTVAFDDHGYT